MTNILQVVFEAVRGRSVSGDIAIDDITYATPQCSVVPSLAVPPTPPPTTPPPIINNCTFEGGFCSWTNLKGDQFDWTRSRGGTSSWSTGPTVDHTLGTSRGSLITHGLRSISILKLGTRKTYIAVDMYRDGSARLLVCIHLFMTIKQYRSKV